MLSTNPKPDLWALVDCNSFYCSCERLFRPDLDGKPVVVLSNNDGCLIALTPEAKALGYKMGDIFFQLEKKLKQDGVTAFSSNYTLYGDLSRRVMATMESLTPGICQYSIDEAFVPFNSALAPQAEDVGWALHDRVKRWVGLPVRVGLGPTRTLAKLANHWAKKKTRVYRLQLNNPELEEILENTPVVDVWGIGGRTAAKLTARGIHNARQLRDMDISLARKLMTVLGERTVMELRGQQCISDDLMPAPRKSLVSSRSFGRAVTEKEDLAEALAMHCGLAGERLRLEGLTAATLAVHMETSRHGDQPYFRAGWQRPLPGPTNDTGEFIKAARQALENCYQPGHKFMKGGIMLFDIADPARVTRSLLDLAEQPKRERAQNLMKALDEVNRKYGYASLCHAAQGQPQPFWAMRRHKLSGAFTTRWEELAQVKA